MEVISYKCPKCSAPLSFSIESQSWKCKFCGSEFDRSEIESFDTQESSEKLETPVSEEVGKDEFINNTVVYSCPSCGGSIITTPTTAATFCVYCHNPTIIASRLENSDNKPVYLIPFKLKKDEVLERLKPIIKKNKFLPKDFRDYISNGEISGLYVPYWLFKMEIEASLKGKGTRVSSWRSGDYKYIKTDTYYIEREGRVTYENIPLDGSKKMDDTLMQALEPFDYNEMVDFHMEYLSGHFAEIHDIKVEEASEITYNRIKPSVSGLVNRSVSLYSSVNYENNVIKKANIKHISTMMPIWVLMADYKGKRYTFAMNGQTGKIAGKLPSDIKLALRYFFILGILITLVFFLGGMLI